jgi:hypothetical protein
MEGDFMNIQSPKANDILAMWIEQRTSPYTFEFAGLPGLPPFTHSNYPKIKITFTPVPEDLVGSGAFAFSADLVEHDGLILTNRMVEYFEWFYDRIQCPEAHFLEYELAVAPRTARELKRTDYFYKVGADFFLFIHLPEHARISDVFKGELEAQDEAESGGIHTLSEFARQMGIPMRRSRR